MIKTCRPPPQKRWFISVPYCPYYSTLVTVLQDFFIGFFRSLSRKYSWKSKKFDNFVQEIQKFLLISHGNRRFPNNSRFYPSLLFSRIPHWSWKSAWEFTEFYLYPKQFHATIKKAFAGIINQHFYFMCWLFIRFLWCLLYFLPFLSEKFGENSNCKCTKNRV